MKLFYTSLKLSFLFFLFFSCKKEEVDITLKLDYLSSECKLSSFTYNSYNNTSPDIRLSTKYNSENLLTDFIGTQSAIITSFPNRRLQYENGQLKRIIIPSEDYPELSPVPVKNAIAAEYEYGKYGVEKIHHYGQYGERIYETEYFEFKYNNSVKPVGMDYYVSISFTEDKFILGLKSTFEYDSNGNLSKELIQNLGGLGGSHDSITKMCFYDDKINTVKQLSYIYFENESPACVFSTNNLVRVKQISTRGDYESNYKLEYDSKNNAIQFPYRFSDAVWDCQ